MRCVSDNGATAPISALTYAFSIDLNRGLETDDFDARTIDTSAHFRRRAPQRQRRRDATCRRCAGKATISRRTWISSFRIRHGAPQSRR
jgi:hypothetical protein